MSRTADRDASRMEGRASRTSLCVSQSGAAGGYGTTTIFVPYVASGHIASPSARFIRIPPVFCWGSGLDIELFVAALNPTVTPLTLANRTTCSIGTPSEPIVLPVREVTWYVPGRGFTTLGMTSKVRTPTPVSLTSQTRFALREYTTREPAPERGGTAWLFCFPGFVGAPDGLAEADAEDEGLGAARLAGAFADAW